MLGLTVLPTPSWTSQLPVHLLLPLISPTTGLSRQVLHLFLEHRLQWKCLRPGRPHHRCLLRYRRGKHIDGVEFLRFIISPFVDVVYFFVYIAIGLWVCKERGTVGPCWEERKRPVDQAAQCGSPDACYYDLCRCFKGWGLQETCWSNYHPLPKVQVYNYIWS